MKKEQLTMFDLEAAFKALDEIEVPKAAKGIRANKEDLKESFKDFNRSRTDLLMEDYYDISDTADLEEAKAEREAEVAKAKLARIEKIVDLEAESEEDLLPSYVGKMIIQCPQCMTLFYKNEEDIVKSETDEETVNVAEVCQHCGNESGYTLIGKVEGVSEEEVTSAPQQEGENIDEPDNNVEEENLDLELNTDEEVVEDDDENLNLDAVDDTDNPDTEDKSEKEFGESLQKELLTEDFDGDKETLKTAINSAMKDPESDKAKIINTVIDHVEEKDIEKVFDLLDKHAGNVKLNKEQIDKIIEKLPENSKEKAKAEKWSTVRNVLDFIDYTPELKENPDNFL
jgi:hypothetical protein